MSYSSLPLTSKLFQLTSLTCALALAGCGGGGEGDTVDSIDPVPPLGEQPVKSDEDTPDGDIEPDFFLQPIAVSPNSIELSDEPTAFTVTIKAAEKASGGAVIDKNISLKIENSENNGITIDGKSTIATDSDGYVTYTLQLNPGAVTDKAALLANGFNLTASATKNDGAVITQVNKVAVFKKGSGDGTQVEVSTLDIQPVLNTSSVSNNVLNAYGDTAVFSVIVKNKNGARAIGVTVGLGITSVKGVAITGGNSKETDSNGIATFNIEVDSKLTKVERDALIQQGIFYVINIKEKSGATKEVSDKFVVAPPISDYKLEIEGMTNKLNAYGDTQQLVITAKPTNDDVPTQINEAKVSVRLNNVIQGVRLSREALILDNKGQATVDLIIPDNLSEASRAKLAKEGVSYTVMLSEPNRSVTTQTYTNNVYIPQAQYQITFGINSKSKISSYGSSAVISFRVNDQNNGGIIANQAVTAILPKELRDAGLLTLDSAATQPTDAKGIVSYTVRVPAGLNATKRAVLEKAGGFALTASMTEASGVSSRVNSERVSITAESETILSSNSIPSVINILKDQFQIQVSGRRPDGSAAAGKDVKLILNEVAGVSIRGSEQTTDAAGNAVFTVNIEPSLTLAQRKVLATSGISYTAILTDEDGIATQKYTAQAAIPTAEYNINFGTSSNPQLSSSGGSTVISFRVNDINGGIIANQKVTAVLPKRLADAGLLTLDSAATQLTDSKGMVNYTVRVPVGLSAERKTELEGIGGFTLTTAIIEASGATSTAVSERVRISNEAQRSETVLSSKSIPSVINVLNDQFQIQVSGKRLNGSAAADKMMKLTIDGVVGVSVQGNEQTTDAAGNAVFTVNLSQDLTTEQRKTLVASGITYTAILTDDDGVATQNYKAPVTLPVAQYNINFGTSSNSRLSSFGGSAVLSFRVNDSRGGAITNQSVVASLPSNLTEQGLLIIEGGAEKVTDINGVVNYTVRVPAGLSAARKAELERISGFALTATLTEGSGATSTVNSERMSITSESATVLSSKTIPGVINVLKDQFQIQVSGKRSNGAAAANKVVKLFIEGVPGVSVEGNEQTTNAAGNAVFTVNLSQDLTDDQRNALIASGITYTAILTDDDGIATIENVNAKVEKPAAEYKISVGTISNPQLSSSGGSTVISFRVNDKNGGIIAGQKVTAGLSKSFTDAGLLTLDSTAEQVTNDKGMVSYTVRVSAGLNGDQKELLETAGSFALAVAMTETSGASSTAVSERVKISDEVKVSATVLSSKTIPGVINVLKDQFQIQVSGKRSNGAAAANKVVKLFIEGVPGVSVEGNEQTTDTAGNAVFTINIESSLSLAQREALAASGITYTAILTDDDGIATQKYTAQAAVPAAEYKINFGMISNQQLSSSGGSTVISFRVNDINGGIVANQRVTAVLPKALTEAGLLTLDGEATQITNNQGMVSYTVRVPAGLNGEQKGDLEDAGNFVLTTATIETSGATSTAESGKIEISSEVQKSATVLSSKSIPNVVNVLKDQFQIQVSSKRPNGGATAGKVVKLTLNDVTGVSVEGNEQTTNAAGDAVFTVNIDKTLTLTQRQALVDDGITYSAILTDEDGIATLDDGNVPAEVPTAEYQINFGTSSKVQLSSSGGSTVISFRVNDKNGGIVANQRVTAVLPKALTEAGLLTLDGEATQITNNQGMVSYTVRVPAGLNGEQKGDLEDAGNFVLTTATIETSGASSTGVSEQIGFSNKVQQSATTLSSKSIPSVVNVLKDQFQIQVSGKRADGSAAASKVMKLDIDGVSGVSVEDSEQTTNAAGNAVFTINIDPSLTLTQREALVDSGIAYNAILTDEDGIATIEDKAQAAIPAAEYQINFGTSSKVQLSSSGGSAIISFRVNDINGGIVANQRVTAVLPKALTDSGLLTLDSAATQVTDTKGMVSYTVRVPFGLSNTQRDALEGEGGFVLTTAIIETSGVASTAVSKRVVVKAQPGKSDTVITSKTIPGVINVLKNQFQIQVSGKRSNGAAAANKVVKLFIEGVPGVSVEGNEQTTDTAGNAVFTINIESSLSLVQREALAASGITYTAILTDDDGIATQKYTAQAAVPAAEYQINFGTISNPQLSSSGGSTVISFRVNDKNGGIIAGQKVTAGLSKSFTDAGLLTLDSTAEQVTNDKGMVSYTVRVSAGLNGDQKELLETAGSFALAVAMTETSGASSTAVSERVKISDEVKVSATVLSSKTIPGVINVLKDQFQIQVSGKRSNGAAAANKVVKLFIEGVPGVSVEGNEQTTNAAGNAVFTVNLSQDLTDDQRNALIASGITYTAILTDDDGIATIENVNAKVEKPAAEYKISVGTISNSQLSSSGGSTVISFRVNDKNGGVIANQNITAKLPQGLIDAGLLTLDSTAAQVTNAKGMVSYTVRVPAGLLQAQKEILEAAEDFVLNAVLTEASGATTDVDSGKIIISDEVKVSATVLSSKTIPGVINVLKDQFQIQVSGKRSNGAAAANKVVKLFIEGVPGVSVEGNEQTTNAAGNAVFTVNLSQDLTDDQRNALIASGITYTAILTDDDGIATIENVNAKVEKPAAEYKISVGTISNSQLSSSGGSTVISFRVNDKNGGVIANQNITAKLPQGLIDAGLLTLDSTAAQVTNAKGMVSYTVRVPAGLLQAQKEILEAAEDFVLNAVLTEASGATTDVDSGKIIISDEVKVSATVLSSKTIPGVINVLKDQFQIQVSGKRSNGAAAANKVVKLFIEGVPGVSVEGNEQTTNAAGNAVFTVNLSQDLTDDQRNALIASGITYTAILTDDDGIATIENVNAKVEKPAAEYKINFNPGNKEKISVFGGTAILSFRVNDSKGGAIANQTVTASLPKELTDAGLLTLDGNTEQVTNDKGVVNYLVRVPAGLNDDQRKELEAAAKDFSLTAVLTEASGATTQVDSERVSFTSVSETILSSKSIPGVVNVLKEQFQIQVSGKRPDGGAAANKVVKLVIDGVPGISIDNNEQITDTDGNVVFMVNLSQDLMDDQRKGLVASGITYTTIITDDDGMATRQYNAPVMLPVAQYQINFGTISSPKLSSSGGSTVISFRVNDKNGGVTANQSVTAVLPKELTDAGLLTLDGDATQLTDSKGMVSYSVRVPAELLQAQKDILEAAGKGKFVLTATVIEDSGATSTVDSGEISISSEVQKSATVLSSKSIPSVVNVLKDQFQIQVSGKRKDGAATGKVVKLAINNVTGISVQDSEQTTNAAGNAVFTINIDPSLTLTQREALVDSGIAYNAILTDEDGIATIEDKAQAAIPAAEYQINFGTSSKVQLSSSGGSAIISFRVNDTNGGGVDKQTVIASLPSNLIDQGLLAIEGSAEQVTDATGMVSYTVRVPTGLNDGQKEALETAGKFVLTAKAIETSGASSVISSTPINIGSAIGQSDIKLVSTSNPKVVTVLDSQFTIQVSAKRPDSSAVVGNVVKLVIENVEGISIQGSEQTTNAAGNAVFTVNLSQDLTVTQREALVASGITYTAMITDDDGTEATIADQKINVEQPATSINFASILTPNISELGGSGSVTVKLLTKDANPQAVEGQAVAIQLGKVALDYGVSVNKESATTDFSGEVTFIVDIPKGLTSEQRIELKDVGIDYQLSYVEKDNTYTSKTQEVNITTPDVDLTVLNPPNLINNRPFYTLNGEGDTAVIQAGLSTQMTSFQIAGQPIELAFENAELAALLNVNGKLGSAANIVSTNADGVVSFTVIVPSNLTQEQKNKLKNQKLTATLKETLTGKKQEIQFNIQSTKAAIDLIAITPKALNLNGGETQIEVIAQDSKDNVIAGQKVFLALPAAIASQGVILATSGTQTTNDSGKATFTIAVSGGLTDAQKAAIGNSFIIALSAADANGNIATKTSIVTTTTPAANGTQENLSIGANKVVNTKGDTFKVFVRVADNEGSITNRDVRLNVDDPIKTGVSVTNGTATTNSDGVATFELTLETGANVNDALLAAGIKLTATTTTAEDVKLEQNYIVAVDNGILENYRIVGRSDKTTLNTGGDQTTTTFIVTDVNGGVLAGVPVQLSIENLEASGAALATSSVVITDEQGKVAAGVLLAANTINARLNHSVVINAKVVTPQYDADGNSIMQVRAQSTETLSAVGTKVTLNASLNNLNSGDVTTVTTTLKDGAERAIANADMELIDAEGNSIATAIKTNADGVAEFNLEADNLDFDDNGNLRVFARAIGERAVFTQRSTNSVNLVKVSQAGISFIDIKDFYNANESHTITIEVRTDSAAQANALIGKQIEVQTTLGNFNNNDVITTQAINATNVDGSIITVPVILTSRLAGTAVLQATVLAETNNGNPKYRTSVDTRFRATTPATMSLQAVRSTIVPQGSTEVVALIKDQNDVPVEGETVVFSRIADASAGRLSAATAVTNNKGEARVVYQANASTAVNGVVINAEVLNNKTIKQTVNITVSKEAVYTTLAFSNDLTSDNIYYTLEGSISVMDGSGRAVPNQDVSIKSYAIEYAQGTVCLLDSKVSYQTADNLERYSEQLTIPMKSGWFNTEDPDYNYTLEKDDDLNGNNRLDAINPVSIIGGTVSDDGYTFMTDEEGRADFSIRYPIRYANWVKVRFDASTFVNGSENTQSLNFELPFLPEDIDIVNGTLKTPWENNASAFGAGGAQCVDSISINVDEEEKTTRVMLTPSQDFSVNINGEKPTTTSQGFNSFVVDFDKAYAIGAIVNVSNNGFSFKQEIKVQ